jgi:2-amino-4-hydroxy-6-hydroxymethyldihydropteridine diphosphokinase
MSPVRAVFLSIGSNIQPEKNIPACIHILKKKFRVKSISSIYETKPVGMKGGRNFWNLAVEIRTPLDKKHLALALRGVEKSLGRRRRKRNKFVPRTIDLDPLPQKHYQKHAFIMIPLAEIAPRVRDPRTGKTLRALAKPFLKLGTPVRKIKLP